MSKEYLYKVGDIINGKLEILELIKIRKKAKNTKNGITYRKGYIVKCLECGYIHEKQETKLKVGDGCPCCCHNPQVVVKGVNDIATTHPHLVKYFANIEDAYTHTYATNKKCLMKCPDCGFEKWITLNKLSQRGFSCNRCGDGISYPNKFVTNILTQLDIDFELEKVFNWSNGKRYDIYIPSLEMIIENHGRQHYEEGFSSCGGRTFKEEQKNDEIKKKLALNNNIKYYIELDCRKSETEWIRQSIVNSKLPQLLNFAENDIDWLKCEKYCTTSLMIKSCELWNSGIKSTTKIGETLKIHPSTVYQYLKKGRKINIVDYNPKEFMKDIGRENGKKSSKKVYMYDLDMNFIDEFPSCSELDRQSENRFNVKLNYKGISSVCTGIKRQYKGYIFSYIKF